MNADFLHTFTLALHYGESGTTMSLMTAVERVRTAVPGYLVINRRQGRTFDTDYAVLEFVEISSLAAPLTLERVDEYLSALHVELSTGFMSWDYASAVKLYAYDDTTGSGHRETPLIEFVPATIRNHYPYLENPVVLTDLDLF